MKNNFKAAAVLSAVLISAVMLTACGNNNSDDKESKIPANASVAASSETNEENSTESEEETSDEKSYTMVTTDSSTEESGTAENSAEDSSSESSAEMSFVSMTESEAMEASNIGYEFDDEQIVTDYHTAETFTDNDYFNELFKSNALDQAFIEETKRASSTSDMMNLTSEYAIKWKEMADTACQALGRDLDEENQQKLNESQKQWTKGLATQEEMFRSEGAGGSEAALSAQTAIMNYYKGRAAKLFEQIYTINGSIDLSEYGL